MTEVETDERAEVIAQLPPSAWIRDGINDPKNSVAILGKKGGPGKTSLTQLIADAGVRLGLNILALDGDPQGNLSIALDSQVKLVPTGKIGLGGKQVMEPDRDTMVEVLEADTDGVIDEAFQLVPWTYNAAAEFQRGGPLIPGRLGTLAIVPTHNPMEDISRGWNFSDLNRLDKALNNPSKPQGIAPNRRWDLVLGDMLPGGSDLARAFLKAMRRYIVLTTAEPFGMNAIANTLTFARDVRDNWGNPELEDIGLVFTSYRPQSRVANAEIADLRAQQDSGNEAVKIEVWKPRVSSRTVVPSHKATECPCRDF